MDAQKSTKAGTAPPGGSQPDRAQGKGDGEADIAETGKTGPRLHPSLVRIRDAMAERQDAFEGLREQERALLQALQEELQAFAEDVPKDDDWVLLTLSKGDKPRFWVDPTSHVAIDRDRRTYRFLRDTKLGRIVLRESGDVRIIAQAVADTIAERMIERERAVEGDWLAAVQANYDEDTKRKDAERAQQAVVPPKRQSGVGPYIAGLASGMIVLFGVWAYKDPAVVEPLKALFAGSQQAGAPTGKQTEQDASNPQSEPGASETQ